MRIIVMKRLSILILSVLALGFSAAPVFGGATVTVNAATSGFVCDGQMSFPEAVFVSRFGTLPRSLTAGEKAQIVGATLAPSPNQPACDGGVAWDVFDGIGSAFADDILFSVNAAPSAPIILGVNDDINGLLPNGSKFVIDGTGSAASTACIELERGSGSQIRNFEIRNCTGSGIWGQGSLGAIFEGLVIHNNAEFGISLGYSLGIQKNVRNVRIGGDQPQHRNLIYSNGETGISISASSSADTSAQNISILNNYIGTSDGTSDEGNTGSGILLQEAHEVTIGDPTCATKNIISGNNNDGITITGTAAKNNSILCNNIGVGLSGTNALGNVFSGVAILGGANNNLIGTAGKGNVIGSNNFGVFIADANSNNNAVKGNYIGVALNATTDVGNSADGVLVGTSTTQNKVGGSGANEANTIAFNKNGIRVEGGTKHRLQRNRVFNNDQLGIDIGQPGVTANDVGDGDTGANDLQNFPVITYVLATSSTVNIKGTLNSIASRTYTLEFFGNTTVDGTGYGEGRNFLGEANVTTNASGNATFDVTFNVPVATTGQYVSATATDPNDNTSEFSSSRNICSNTLISPTGLIADAAGGSGAFTVIRSTGCSAASPVSNNAWITVNSFNGSTAAFTVAPNHGPQRAGSISVHYNNGQILTFVNFNITQAEGSAAGAAPFDFDGDGKTDPSIVRPGANSEWWYVQSSDGTDRAAIFGSSGDKIVPADFTGDGKTDIAYWQPSTGYWYIIRSENNSYYGFPFGANGDVPVPADYDGDGTAEPAVFRPSTGIWYILGQSGDVTSVPFGAAGDRPVIADYDGDGKADIAVFRPSNGSWWLRRSTNGSVFATVFGLATDRPVPGKYTSDNKADIAFWRPSNGTWYVLRSEDNSYYEVPFGTSGDIPVPGDYDGDGRTDMSVFRPSTAIWYLQRSSAGVGVVNFGAAGDIPVPAAFVP
ncbi:MAG: hypothetical protein DCC44_04195 [Acidobacteria bacterium]|nr:hypothetical protein [Pyrinomonadaceae bacterium]RIJ94532.1 MAG: hypothetical protein DCC44_04195 [Acidobacteriota bacterium]